MVGACRHLGRMRNGEHLHAAGELRKPHANGIGHRTAHPRIDFVENERWCGPAVGEHDFEREQETRNSPPDATFIKGPGRVPGFVCTQNSTRSKPFGPADAESLSICVENLARSSLSGLSSPLTALSRAPAAFPRAFESPLAAAL